jgi:hypothetical protein
MLLFPLETEAGFLINVLRGLDAAREANALTTRRLPMPRPRADGWTSSKPSRAAAL